MNEPAERIPLGIKHYLIAPDGSRKEIELPFTIKYALVLNKYTDRRVLVNILNDAINKIKNDTQSELQKGLNEKLNKEGYLSVAEALALGFNDENFLTDRSVPWRYHEIGWFKNDRN